MSNMLVCQLPAGHDGPCRARPDQDVPILLSLVQWTHRNPGRDKLYTAARSAWQQSTSFAAIVDAVLDELVEGAEARLGFGPTADWLRSFKDET